MIVNGNAGWADDPDQLPPSAARVLLDTISVYVKPGPAYRLVVENAPSAARGLNLTGASPVEMLTLPSTTLKDSLWAILRDRYDNYVRNANPADWNVITGGTVVSLARIEPLKRPPELCLYCFAVR